MPSDAISLDRTTPPSVPPAMILSVADDPACQQRIRSILDGPDYQVVSAPSESAALRTLLRQEVSAILLDASLPGTTAADLIRFVRQRDRTRHLPIVLLTDGPITATLWEQSHASGFSDILTKPVDRWTLTPKMAGFAEIHRLRQQLEAQAASLSDATAQQQEGMVLRSMWAAERRHGAIADMLPEIIWMATRDGVIDYLNRRWFEVVGVGLGEVQGGFQGVIHPDDRDRFTIAWQQALAEERTFHSSCRLRHRDGRYFWNRVQAQPTHGQSGEVIAWVGTFTDVDEQRRYEALLTTYKEALDALVEVVVIFDRSDGTIIYANQGATNTIGSTFAELRGAKLGQVFPAHDGFDLTAVAAGLDAAPHDGQALEAVIRRKDGTEIPIELGLQLVVDNQDQVIVIARDVTVRRRSQEERERLYREAVEALRLRDEFLSLASHELRTPLTSLQLQLQFAQMLVQQAADEGLPSPAAILNAFDVSLRQLSRLGRLIRELLDVTRLTNGKVSLRFEEVNLASIVSDMAGQFDQELQRSGSTLTVKADDPVLARVDKDRMEQVVANLISNAIKYGDGKPIEVSVSQNGPRALLSVHDHGIGIATEDHNRIFERFGRAVAWEHISGLGLGLFIVKELIKAHGGTIQVTSDLGDGATFVVDLPVIPDEDASETEVHKPEDPDAVRRDLLR